MSTDTTIDPLKDGYLYNGEAPNLSAIASAPTTEAQQIVNEPVTVKAFGRTYRIGKFTMGPLVRALPHIAPLGYLLRSATKADITELLVTSLSIGGEPALGLISVATSEPLEWLEDKDPLDGLDVLVAIVEKNADYFFDQANLARLKTSFAKLESIVQKHGGSISTT